MNPAKIATMLSLQNALNIRVNPNWLSAGYAWHRAIFVEAAEAMDHWGYKWWKKQEPNVAEVQMELIDIWHFMMSLMIVQDAGDLERTRSRILQKQNRNHVTICGQTFDVASMDFKQRLDLLVGAAGMGQTSVVLFDAMLEDVGLTWDEVFRQYVSKNVLNMFRQDHGYKEGTYQKTWNGEEDNSVLIRLMGEINADDPSFATNLMTALEDAYLEATK